MRINVDIDDALLAEAMQATGQTTKRATVEEALKTLVRMRESYQAIRKLEQSGLAAAPDLPGRKPKA
ncbi:MAG TPA: type II toxin-antitoxin system VapB family antitoxin [Acetobacteraceae bacterium]|jgi:Arc/MetJ family transcription regulator|nr:type II toxin-antitoxin system VapB family antitoxin [Acetobacteraceae bacterium]